MRRGEITPMDRWWYLRARNVPRDLRVYGANVVPARAIRRFCILTTFRTGSEVLVELLDGHPRIRCDGEIMNGRPLSPFLYARGKARAASLRRYSAYGFKLLSIQLIDLFNPPDRAFVERLASDGYLMLHLRRRNILRQAISYFRARATGDWHPRVTGHPVTEQSEHAGSTPSSVTVDIPTLFFEMRLIDVQNDALSWMCEGLPHRVLWYEDQLEDPEHHQSTVDGICADLAIEPAGVAARLRKIAPKRLDDAVSNYDEVVEHLERTRYKVFLDD